MFFNILPVTCPFPNHDVYWPLRVFSTQKPVYGNRYAVDALASYQYHWGWKLHGPRARTCQITGSWSGQAPICKQSN